jgi:hypothetical protein
MGAELVDSARELLADVVAAGCTAVDWPVLPYEEAAEE